mmetsp:Transcript_600/g.1693  ORF Transcript_600/g.1693 Transcript_600/m.1693 type:complete len:233 (+) Transcript_600:156-854(+)
MQGPRHGVRHQRQRNGGHGDLRRQGHQHLRRRDGEKLVAGAVRRRPVCEAYVPLGRRSGEGVQPRVRRREAGPRPQQRRQGEHPRGPREGHALRPVEEHGPKLLGNPLGHDGAVPVPVDVPGQALRPGQVDGAGLRSRPAGAGPVSEAMESGHEALGVLVCAHVHEGVPHAQLGNEIDGHIHEVVDPHEPHLVHHLYEVLAQEGARQVAQDHRGGPVLASLDLGGRDVPEVV